MGDKERFGKLPELDQPKPRARTCANCSHFALEIPGQLPPTCRAKIPTLINMVDQRTGSASLLGAWPPTSPDRWCGEHLLDASHFQ